MRYLGIFTLAVIPFVASAAYVPLTPADDSGAARAAEKAAQQCAWYEYRKWRGAQSVMPPDDDEIETKMVEINKICGSSMHFKNAPSESTAPRKDPAAAPPPAGAGEASVTAMLYVSVVFLYGFIAFALMPLWWAVIRLCLLPLFRRTAREVKAAAVIFYLVGAVIVAGCVYVALVIKPLTGVLFVPPFFIAWGAQLLAFFNDPLIAWKKRNHVGT